MSSFSPGGDEEEDEDDGHDGNGGWEETKRSGEPRRPRPTPAPPRLHWAGHGGGGLNPRAVPFAPSTTPPVQAMPQAIHSQSPLQEALIPASPPPAPVLGASEGQQNHDLQGKE